MHPNTNAIRLERTRLEFQRADDDWSKELKRIFGKSAGDVRYTSRGIGDFGTMLRVLHDIREAKRIEWEAARQIA